MSRELGTRDHRMRAGLRALPAPPRSFESVSGRCRDGGRWSPAGDLWPTTGSGARSGERRLWSGNGVRERDSAPVPYNAVSDKSKCQVS